MGWVGCQGHVQGPLTTQARWEEGSGWGGPEAEPRWCARRTRGLGGAWHRGHAPPAPQVARRCWSGSPKAYEVICQTMREDSGVAVTLPHAVAEERVLQALRQ